MLYQYKHLETGEIFEEFRSVKNRNKSFIAPDGKKCKRVDVPKSVQGWSGNREVFEADPVYVKKCHPKKIKFRDGHIEKYDPTKHC